MLDWFDKHIYSRIPHIENGKVVAPTPLIQITELVRDAAKELYGLNLGSFEALAKLESNMPSGSIKMRSAANILRDAILHGKLRRGMTIFEATSGNFGIALGTLNEAGINVVAIISRKLEEGVKSALAEKGVKILDMNADICPVPISGKVNMQDNALAKDTINKLGRFGLDPEKAKDKRVYEAISKQDAIELAHELARIYGGFCPSQYTNASNWQAYKTMGLEIEQQLWALGKKASDFSIFCTFGTGGTSTGLSKYFIEKHNRRNVVVVFPMPSQDVAGIRTKEKAGKLKFYNPKLYAKEMEMNFEEARGLIDYVARRGISIGESSALALYAAIRAIENGEKRVVVIFADSAEKYASKEAKVFSIDEIEKERLGFEAVIWAHNKYKPNAAGISLIAKAFGKDPDEIIVLEPETVARIISGEEIQLPFPTNSIAICIGGIAAKAFADSVAKMGIKMASLKGGLMEIAAKYEKQIEDLIEQQ
ncbi:MAG: pyridoxal-phosphate dependent enzyme [Candidatus Micrarchaeia archaeon]